MIFEGNELWPTWLSVPALTTRVDKIYATFRIVGTSKHPYSGFSGGSGGPPLINWCFYNILERFLLVGAGYPGTKKNDELVSVKMLKIDFQTPNVPADMLAPEEMSRPDQLYNLRVKSGINYLMHPNRISNFIIFELNSLLRMSYHTAEMGAIMFERIGAIRITVDGKVREEWDLAEMLAAVRFADSFCKVPREERPEFFKKWKTNAYETRVQLGLPVAPFKEARE